MKITKVETTPLLIPYREPMYWAHGAVSGATVILVEIQTDQGITGYGECIGTPSAAAIQKHLRIAGDICVGRDPFDNARLMADAYHALFQSCGTGSSPRYGGQVLAGIEMALWDVAGKASGRAVHELLGGRVHDNISYFGFAQGDTADATAASARKLSDAGREVIYLKVGRGDALDTAIVGQVRAAIGPDKRLRVDANESWSPVQALRMIGAMAQYDVEMVEQPTPAESISALARLRQKSPLAIGADQLVFTPNDTYDVCCEGAADLIVLGLHETGGLLRLGKAAHIAEAAGIDICIHGLYESGITTCASNQIAATIPNLDDANQYMNDLLQWDIVKTPALVLDNGKLPVLPGPGLGFELDFDAVARAADAYESQVKLRNTP